MRWSKRLVLAKCLALVVTVTAGCLPPMEAHGGAAPRPEPSDLTFIGAGAATDAALQLVHVPLAGRLVGVGALTWALRFPRWGGRYEGVTVTVPFGAYWPEFVRFLRVAHQQAHPPCQYAGMDGVVHQGRRYGEDCR